MVNICIQLGYLGLERAPISFVSTDFKLKLSLSLLFLCKIGKSPPPPNRILSPNLDDEQIRD